MKAHPIADLFPMMSAEELAALTESMRVHGYDSKHPIMTYEGIILDGRNRYAAAESAGIRPTFTEWTNGDPWDFVWRENAVRRHLEASQKAAIAIEFVRGSEAWHCEREAAAKRANEARAEKARESVRLQPRDDRGRVQSPPGQVSRDTAPGREPDRERAKIAAVAGVSPATVGRVLAVQQKSPEQFERVKRGEVAASRALTEAKRVEVRERLEDVSAREAKATSGVYDVIVIDPPWPMEKIERDVRPNQVAFDYPTMSEDELYDRIQSEASQHIPFDIADVNHDYQLLETLDSQMDVLLVAVKKDKILNHTNVLAQAGKNSVVVDIDAFALQNCYEVNYDPDPGQTVALLNVGASVMNINIVRGGIPLFTRDVSVGGNQYTDALQKELDQSFDDAERLKQGENIAGVAEEHRDTILRSVTDILILEIQKTFDFFRATATGESIQKIVVAGGSSRVPGLLDVLREEFSIPVEEMYPFRKIVINPGRHNEEQIRELAPRLAIAVGLALRSFDEP